MPPTRELFPSLNGTSAPATGAALHVMERGPATAVFSVEGLVGADTVVARGTSNGTDYYVLEVASIGARSTPLTAMITDGVYFCDVTGLTAIRLDQVGDGTGVGIMGLITIITG